MNVVVRTDASVGIGHGHVMRCLTLATELRERGATVSFICRAQAGDLRGHISEQGFAVHSLPDDVVGWERDADASRSIVAAGAMRLDWIIVDQYEFDARWEKALAQAANGIMVIDDLANRAHDCDVLLDQNFFPDAHARYAPWVPVWCARYTGPEYVLLRREFREAIAQPPTRTSPRLLVFFGGGDPTGQSLTALEAALEFAPDMPMDVILGRDNPRAAEIQRRFGERENVNLMTHTPEIARYMRRATLCLGAGGIATFERLALGLPSIVVSTADNQREPLAALAGKGCIEYLGDAGSVGRAEWVSALERWHDAPRAPAALDVGSGTPRLIDGLETAIVPFSERHLRSTFEFLADAGLREAFAMGDAPEWSRHVAYWNAKLAAGVEKSFAIERSGKHVGNCGIKPILHGEDHEGWIYLAPDIGRRTGLGEIAFRRLLRIALREWKLPRLFLHVRRDNAAALRLYGKLGFRAAAEPVDPRVWGDRAPSMVRLVTP